MSNEGDVNQDISGNHNTQINSGENTIAAIGDGAFAAGGDIIINQGLTSEEVTKILANTVNADVIAENKALKEKIAQMEKEKYLPKKELLGSEITEQSLTLGEKGNLITDWLGKYHLGNAAFIAGNLKIARGYFEESINELDRSKAGLRLVITNSLVSIDIIEGNFQSAILKSMDLLAEMDEIGTRILVCDTQTNIGILSQRIGEYNNAIKSFNLVLDYARDNADQERLLVSLINLASVCIVVGDHDEARRHIETGFGMALMLNDSPKLAALYVLNGKLDFEKTNFPKAKINFEKADKEAIQSGFRMASGEANLGLSKLYFRLENYEKAETHISRALTISEKTSDVFLQGKVLLQYEKILDVTKQLQKKNEILLRTDELLKLMKIRREILEIN